MVTSQMYDHHPPSLTHTQVIVVCVVYDYFSLNDPFYLCNS
jgi:hypothetical protein